MVDFLVHRNGDIGSPAGLWIDQGFQRAHQPRISHRQGFAATARLTHAAPISSDPSPVGCQAGPYSSHPTRDHHTPDPSRGSDQRHPATAQRDRLRTQQQPAL